MSGSPPATVTTGAPHSSTAAKDFSSETVFLRISSGYWILPQADALQVAAEERLQHRHERVAFPPLQLLRDDVLPDHGGLFHRNGTWLLTVLASWLRRSSSAVRTSRARSANASSTGVLPVETELGHRLVGTEEHVPLGHLHRLERNGRRAVGDEVGELGAEPPGGVGNAIRDTRGRSALAAEPRQDLKDTRQRHVLVAEDVALARSPLLRPREDDPRRRRARARYSIRYPGTRACARS